MTTAEAAYLRLQGAVSRRTAADVCEHIINRRVEFEGLEYRAKYDRDTLDCIVAEFELLLAEIELRMPVEVSDAQ